jgi:hypothetical protein
MRNGFLVVTTLLCAGATLAQAQEPKGDLPEQAPAPAVSKSEAAVSQSEIVIDPVTSAPASDCFSDGCNCACPPRFWGSVEYLLWWIRNGPISSPLVTTGTSAGNPPGALGQPGTQVLFGDRAMDYGAFSGMRLGAGVYLNNWLSVEGSYFALERRSVQFNAASDPSGNPFLLRPVFNVQDGFEEAFGIAVPDPALGPWAGSVHIDSHTRLQGWELNLAASRWSNDCWSFGVLAGFRALDLNEDLNILENITPIQAGVLSFGGGPADPPSTMVVYDGMHTVNHFYGGQVGGRLTWQQDRLSVNLTVKVALGGTQQTENINGASTLLTPGAAPVTLPGGVLATTSNIGIFHHSTFSVVPEVGINVGWNITENLKATFGYNFLYWSQVIRPGNQIDHNNNPSLVPTSQFFGNGLGSNVPAVNFRETGFWAQGLTFGLVLTF